MRRKLFALIFVGFLAVILSVAVNAEPDGPQVRSPYKYSEHRIGNSVTFEWNAPDSSYGTVDHYEFAYRGFKIDDNVTSNNVGTVIEKRTLSKQTNYLIISGTTLLNYYRDHDYEKYRVSVCAVMKDGTKRWSDHIYFYLSTHNTPLNPPISFHIYNGFSAESKEKIYYSCQNWNNKLNLGYEVMNTYPYTQGTDKVVAAEDGINIVTKGVIKTNPDALMATYSWCDDSGSNRYRTYESDIVVNYDKPWANYISNDTYYFYDAMMHEMGHVVGLNDKYDSWAKEWTMYGKGSKGEDKRITIMPREVINAISLYD